MYGSATKMNGFLAEESLQSVSEVLPWLQEAIAPFYPASAYTASLAPQARERAAQRVFQPPRAGHSVRCPRCSAPNATMLDEVFAFVCNHCG